MFRGCVLWLLLCLPAPLYSQLTVLPSAGKAAGFVSAPEPGKWIVFAAGFMPVQPTLLDGGKSIIFEGEAGDYAVIYLPPGDAQPLVQKVVLGGAAPGPEPKPEPEPGPNPTPTKWQVVIFVESADMDSMGLAQLELTNSLLFRQKLKAAGHTFLGVWDKDQATAQAICSDGSCRTVSVGGKYAAYWNAVKGDPMPRVALAPVGGGDVQDFPLPVDEVAFFKLLDETKEPKR